MKNYLFFDNASTTKVDPAACEQVNHYMVHEYGNPSSTHFFGRKAENGLRSARAFFSSLFHCEPDQTIFTGSGTEANNLAILGTVLPQGLGKQIFISSIEHPSVRKPAMALADFGTDVQTISLSTDGKISIPDVLDRVTPSTRLVSIQTVNPVLGVVFPVIQIAQELKKKFPHILFHTDAVQGFCKVDHPTTSSAVDLVSISSHKIHGPKGVGALIVLNKNLLKAGASRMRPVIFGGDQEFGLRSGTPHVGLIAGFQAAAEIAWKTRNETQTHILGLRNRLQRELEEIPLRWNSPPGAIPNIVSLSCPGVPAAAFARVLEERGCLVSVGSACTSKKHEGDPILKAAGLPPEVQTSSIRISFSRENTFEEIAILGQAIRETFIQMSRLVPSLSQKRI